MEYVNPPANAPEHITHHILFSQIYNHELGYNIYLPPDYATSGGAYPAAYHLHGWTGNESSEIGTLARLCAGRRAITVFPNNSPVIGELENLPVESMVLDELVPHIEATYRTDAMREGRSISGFSMGGGAAFMYAVKHPELFAAVTVYAGTFHHYLRDGIVLLVEKPPETVSALYARLMAEKRDLEAGSFFEAIRQNAAQLRGRLQITIHVGADDPLFCENAIAHLYLESLDIPHDYIVYEGAGHELERIL